MIEKLWIKAKELAKAALKIIEKRLEKDRKGFTKDSGGRSRRIKKS